MATTTPASRDEDGGDKFGGNSRSAVWLRLTPNPERNRFYNIELADTPYGQRNDKTIEETVTNPATGQSQTTITQQTKFDRSFLVSAQAGWNLTPFAVRLGMIDSTGGAGVDYFFNNRISVTGEAFDFGHRTGDNNPHLRLFGEYVFRQREADHADDLPPQRRRQRVQPHRLHARRRHSLAG